MIHLTKVRLVNWYAFQDETFPVGDFTLIAGKNGNGKSVILDALRFAALGDTEFNKSTETKTSRTIISYTRGLLDATSNTYIRSIEKNPNVYSHIVLEMHDDINEKYFLLGVILETKSADTTPAQFRYIVDQKNIEYLKLTRIENNRLISLSARDLQDTYKITMHQKTEGMKHFMYFTGLKLSDKDLQEFIRRMRSMLAYDPKVKIDEFIREKVLKKETVDFSKLIESRERIDALTATLNNVQAEIEELTGIENQSDEYEHCKMRILVDDIKQCFIKKEKLQKTVEKLTSDIDMAANRAEVIKSDIDKLKLEDKQVSNRMVSTLADLRNLDCSRSIEDEKRNLGNLLELSGSLKEEVQVLELFSAKISEIIDWLIKKGEKVPNKNILASLTGNEFNSSEKETSVTLLKKKLREMYDECIIKKSLLQDKEEKINQLISIQDTIIEECWNKVSGFGLIHDYVYVRDEINKELQKRGINEKAHFACEYVIKVKDDSWQDAIESFLGKRRYVILIDPKYYDIADAVFNRLKNKQAHLFNTKLLMQKNFKIEKDSVYYQLEIKNQVAKQYFAYQLRSMHAVSSGEVKNFENAISKDGRVSVSMDSYFLNFDTIKAYYFGSSSFKKNLEKAKKEKERLEKEYKEFLEQAQDYEKDRKRINADLDFFKQYNYNAIKEYSDCLKEKKESEERLKDLENALKNDLEFSRLNEHYKDLLAKQEDLKTKISDLNDEKTTVKGNLEKWKLQWTQGKQAFNAAEIEFQQYEHKNPEIVRGAVISYKKFIKSAGKVKTGNVLLPESRAREERSVKEAEKSLTNKELTYNVHYPDRTIDVNTEDCSKFRHRKRVIWMDNLQEIKEKLDEQTKRYKSIFKTEFVLGVYTHCIEAKENLRDLNIKLAKLDFSTVYKFDVHFLTDSSDFAHIIEYGKMLAEKTERRDSWGQMNLFSLDDSEEEECLEKEMDEFLGRIMAKKSEDLINRYADYRNYMTYEILLSNDVLTNAKLSKQAGFNSGAEIQIPYMLILASALLLMYDSRPNSTRIVFIDEPFAKMDPLNVTKMIRFMKEQNLQVIFCAPDKTEVIGNECDVILPTLRTAANCMKIGSVKFNKG